MDCFGWDLHMPWESQAVGDSGAQTEGSRWVSGRWVVSTQDSSTLSSTTFASSVWRTRVPLSPEGDPIYESLGLHGDSARSFWFYAVTWAPGPRNRRHLNLLQPRTSLCRDTRGQQRLVEIPQG